MQQLKLHLMGRMDAPSVAPPAYVQRCSTYRQAVRFAWGLRRVQHMTLRQLSAEADLRPQLVSDYLHADDKPHRRNLPAERIAGFEAVCGNTLLSQWIAARARLTVLEELQAMRMAA